MAVANCSSIAKNLWSVSTSRGFLSWTLSHFCTSSTGAPGRVKLTSYLCVPPSMSQAQVAILTPYFGHLDLSPRGLEGLRSNLERRRMPLADLDGLARDWDRRMWLRAELERLEKAREASVQEIRQKLGQGLTDKDIPDLIADSQSLKAETKAVAQSLRDLEEVLMPKILALPNDVHPATPLHWPENGQEVGGPDEETSKSDDQGPVEEISGAKDGSAGRWNVRASKGSPTSGIDAQRSKGFLDKEVSGAADLASRSGLGPYYEGRLALAELAALDYFSDRFSDSGFQPFSGPDFCKPVVVEGCGLDFVDPRQTLLLRPDPISGLTDFHLVGSASLPPFCAFLTKCSMSAAQLPLRLFATGRSYRPPEGRGWQRWAQSSQLHFFAAVDSSSDEDAVFAACIVALTVAYEALGFCCRLVDVPAAELSPAESRRSLLQVRLPPSQTCWTVADVASCGDYVSKRLWMCLHDETSSGFVRVVHGTGLSFPALLDCLADGGRAADREIPLPEPLLDYMADYHQ